LRVSFKGHQERRILGNLICVKGEERTEVEGEPSMAKKGPDSHHVVPSKGKGGWDVKRGGANRASGHFDTKKDAVDAGRKISQNQGTELRIHNKEGKISQSDSHGNDPCPPKG